MILETLPAVNALTVDQKLRLACELVQDASRDVTVPDALGLELYNRLKAHEADPTQVKSTAEVTAGLLELKRRLTTHS
jgi:hypothetical protein